MTPVVITKYPDGLPRSVKRLSIMGKRKTNWRVEETVTKRFTWEEFIQQ